MIHPNGVRSELFIHSIDPETKTVTLASRLIGEAYCSDPGWGGTIENLDIPEELK